MPKRIFVFGSNSSGIHGAGAAKTAAQKHGAQFGKGYGHYGDSFAIPTKDEWLETLPTEHIMYYVAGFLAYATDKRKLTFKITRVGCGLACKTDKEMAELFMLGGNPPPKNCMFDEAWRPYLGDEVSYWGTQP